MLAILYRSSTTYFHPPLPLPPGTTMELMKLLWFLKTVNRKYSLHY